MLHEGRSNRGLRSLEFLLVYLYVIFALLVIILVHLRLVFNISWLDDVVDSPLEKRDGINSNGTCSQGSGRADDMFQLYIRARTNNFNWIPPENCSFWLFLIIATKIR